jgi:hypothetical protein
MLKVNVCIFINNLNFNSCNKGGELITMMSIKNSPYMVF